MVKKLEVLDIMIQLQLYKEVHTLTLAAISGSVVLKHNTEHKNIISSEGPAAGHLDTRFSRFPCVYKQTLRRFPTFQVATTCFSCSPPYLNLLVTIFIFCVHVK